MGHHFSQLGAQGVPLIPLSDIAIRRFKATEKPYRRTDGAGLYVEVRTNGSKYWRMKYRFDGAEKRYAIGVYPDVSLARARELAYEAKQLLKGGLGPVTKLVDQTRCDLYRAGFNRVVPLSMKSMRSYLDRFHFCIRYLASFLVAA